MLGLDQPGHRRLTDALLGCVLAAGRIEMGYFGAGVQVETKADLSPVTIADQQAEALILSVLACEFPGCAVVAEEAFAAGARPALTDPFFLVDALDGTKQFVSGEREFTINIGLVSAGRPVYGLVYAPALGDLIVTAGADCALRAAVMPDAMVCTLADVTAHRVRVKPPSGSLVALLSRSRNAEAANRFLADFPVSDIRRLGSSYKFSLIAAGDGDLYPQFGGTNEWDTAAGEAIVLAAGGCVTTFDGQPLTYGKADRDFKNELFVASSSALTRLRREGA
jgi:3'(2'), 5'-bisphosphate nucleotidase